MTVELASQKRLGAALFYGILVVLAYLVFLVFQPFLAPLAWAVVLVVVSYPIYSRLARKWGATLAATASTVGVILILIVPALLVTRSVTTSEGKALLGVFLPGRTVAANPVSPNSVE